MDVVVATPGPDDLEAIGGNVMDAARRSVVFEVSLRTSTALFEQLRQRRENLAGPGAEATRGAVVSAADRRAAVRRAAVRRTAVRWAAARSAAVGRTAAENAAGAGAGVGAGADASRRSPCSTASPVADPVVPSGRPLEAPESVRPDIGLDLAG
jgi:hypothetical protein